MSVHGIQQLLDLNTSRLENDFSSQVKDSPFQHYLSTVSHRVSLHNCSVQTRRQSVTICHAEEQRCPLQCFQTFNFICDYPKITCMDFCRWQHCKQERFSPHLRGLCSLIASYLQLWHKSFYNFTGALARRGCREIKYISLITISRKH